jgi:hypothetical protein
MRIELYFEEEELKHFVKRLKPLIKQKINWCETGTIVSKEDKIMNRLVSEFEYILKNPEIFIDKPRAIECACMNDIVCCNCGEELFEDEYESSSEPFADEMHDYFILHRRCPNCEREKRIKAESFIKEVI